jgi:hypothetical protein
VIGGPNGGDSTHHVMAPVALAAQHDDIFRRLKPAALVRKVVDFERLGRRAEGAAMMGAFQRIVRNPSPFRPRLTITLR